MRDRVALPEIVGIAGRHERQAETVRDLLRPLGAAALDVQAVVLDLDVEVLAERLVEPDGDFLRLVQLVLEDELAELARRAARQADEPFAVSGEDLLVDARDVVEAFGVGDGAELDEVLEADLILGEEREVVAGVAPFLGLAISAMSRGDVRLVADDRIDAGGLAFLVELDRPEEIAVIGEGRKRSCPRLDVGDELLDSAGAVEVMAVVGMAVEMDEGSFSPWRRVIRRRRGSIGSFYEAVRPSAAG